ncbi:MAG: alginate lyase family protein, partial [Anaerolineae bacterium]
NRFHHAVRLGQAYLYTYDERYAREIVSQIQSWIKANPYEFGVNWAGPMDVAIRAVNWIWAMYCIHGADPLTDEVLALWLTSLHQHGEYIEKHLEDGWPRTNHLIANLTGLAYIGIMFPEFTDADRWREMGLNGIWAELSRQINADGLSYEASTGYHRLVTEMVLHVIGLCIINDIPVPEPAIQRTATMLDSIMLYTQPNGIAPQIGDFDSGRLVPLTVHVDEHRTQHDHRHLLALGSIILERESPEWAGFVDPTQRAWSIAAGDEWQDAFWLFASDASARYTDVLTLTTEQPEGTDPDAWVEVAGGMRIRGRALANRTITFDDLISSHGLEASGLYIMRQDSLHMTIDAGSVGTDGVGGHAHNDVFSLTMQAFGQSFIVDPGSYLYTSEPEERNAFRSTAYHNTLQVGTEEINPIPDDDLFALPDAAHIAIRRWISNNDYDLLDGSHDGYKQLGVVHRRQVVFDKRNRLWLIRDTLEPVKGEPVPVDVTLRFHLPPELDAQPDRDRTVRVLSQQGPGMLIVPFGEFPLEASVRDGWYAPRYGVKERTPVVTYSGKTSSELILMLFPRPDGSKIDIRSARAIGQDSLVSMRRIIAPGGSRFAR